MIRQMWAEDGLAQFQKPGQRELMVVLSAYSSEWS